MNETPLTHQSVNSAAQLLAIIRRCERQHWFAGLRQAELEAGKLQAFLGQFPRWKRWWWQLTRQWQHLAPIRDAEYQLALARAEKARIVEEHPEALLKGYKTLQEKAAQEMRLAQNSHFIAAQQLAMALSIPPAAAELLLGLTPGEREQVLLQARVLTQGVERQVLPLPPEKLQSLQIELAQITQLQSEITVLPPYLTPDTPVT